MTDITPDTGHPPVEPKEAAQPRAATASSSAAGLGLAAIGFAF
jgi:hypothetical protein